MISSSRLKQVLLMALPVFAIVFFYLIKVFQFQQNQESFSDGLMTLELSKGWLEGKKLLHDNLYWNHAKLHNYYFVILLGPLTRFTGIYGLFIVYLGLLGLFFWLWAGGFSRFGTGWVDKWLAAVFYCFGPIAYFVFLDRYGWHPEHYFMPLLALLALSLARRQFGVAVLLTILTFTIKETSPVLIFCLFLFCSVTDLILLDPGKKPWDYLVNRRNLVIGIVCFTLFCAGMAWLTYLSGPGASRLLHALSILKQNITSWELVEHTLSFCMVAVAVTSIALLPFVALLRFFNHKTIILFMLLGGCVILSAVYYIESLYYFGNFPLGLSYAPRIGGIWAFIFSAYIFLSYRLSQQVTSPGSSTINWVWIGYILQFLIGPFLVTHSFTLKTDFDGLKSNLTYMVRTRLCLYPYVDENAKQLYALSKRLPDGANVIAPLFYLGCFQNVYPGTWLQGAGVSEIHKSSSLLVYEKHLIDKVPYHIFPKSGYTVIPNKDLLILAESKWYNQNFK